MPHHAPNEMAILIISTTGCTNENQFPWWTTRYLLSIIVQLSSPKWYVRGWKVRWLGQCNHTLSSLFARRTSWSLTTTIQFRWHFDPDYPIQPLPRAHIHQQACEYLNKTSANSETKSLIHGKKTAYYKKKCFSVYISGKRLWLITTFFWC